MAKPKHFYKDWRWHAGAASIVATRVIEARSTCRAQALGYAESNPLLGAHPSCAHVTGFELGAAASMITLHALAWHCAQDTLHPLRCYGLNQYDGHRANVWTPIVLGGIPAANDAISLHDAIHNYRLPRTAPREMFGGGK